MNTVLYKTEPEPEERKSTKLQNVDCINSKVTPCLTLWDPTDYTVYGIHQARILEWVVSCPMSESPSGKREDLHDNATHRGREFIADSSQGPCRNQRSGAESESPEPQFPHTFIGCSISNISSG